LDPGLWLVLPELMTGLQDISAAQHQPGLVTLLKELQVLHDERLKRLEQASPETVLRLVVDLQLEGQYQSDANHDQLQEQLLSSLRLLKLPNAGQAATTAAGAAGGAAPLAGEVSLARTVLCQFSVPELAALVAAVVASGVQHQQGSATSGTGAKPVEPPHGFAELSILLQVLLESEVLLQSYDFDDAAAGRAKGGGIGDHLAAGAAELPSAVEAVATDQQQQQQQQAPAAPPPPPPPTQQLSQQQQQQQQQQPEATADLAPLKYRQFSQQDWTGLAKLVKLCVESYPSDLLPPHLIQLVLEVSLQGGDQQSAVPVKQGTLHVTCTGTRRSP
jgi:hypothetical protein